MIDMIQEKENHDKRSGYLTLCYHYIRPDVNDPFPRIIGTKESNFKDQIKKLKENFEMISLKEVQEFSYGKKLFNYDTQRMLITFDDGLSDHYNAAKILESSEIKATFFIPTCILKEKLPANPMIIHYGIAIYGLEDFLEFFRETLKNLAYDENKFHITYDRKKDNVWKKIDEIKSIFKYNLEYKESRKILLDIYQSHILEDFPDILKKIHLNKEQIKEMIEMGHSIGVHTHTHISVSATSLTKNEFYKEIIFPKKYFESEFNIPVIAFSYPFGEKKDCLSAMKLLHHTNEYKLAFTAEEIVNFQNTSPLELGRYLPKGQEDARTLTNSLSNIIKK